LFDENCEYVVDKPKKKIFVHATVDIEPGTELFIRYNDGESEWFNGEKLLSKGEVESLYNTTIEKGNLMNINLRHSSSKLPGLVEWVNKSKAIIETLRAKKRARNQQDYRERIERKKEKKIQKKTEQEQIEQEKM